MRVLFLGIASIFLVLTAISCQRFSSGPYVNEVKQIDSLLTLTHDMKSYLTQLDTAALTEKFRRVDEDYYQIKDSLWDRITLQSGTYLNVLKSVRKIGSNFQEEYSTLLSEFNYSQKQLENLKTDVKSKALSKDEVKKYIRDEEVALDIINYHFKRFQVRINLLLNEYDKERQTFYDQIEA